MSPIRGGARLRVFQVVVGVGLLLLLGVVLFDLPPSPWPLPPLATCFGGLRLRAVVLPYATLGKGPLLLAVNDGGPRYSFFLTPVAADYTPGEVFYRWVSLSVCRPIVRNTIVPAGFVVGAPASTTTVTRILAALWGEAEPLPHVAMLAGRRYLVVPRLMPPGKVLRVGVALPGYAAELVLPLAGASVGARGAESYFALPPTLPAGSGVLRILAPSSWQLSAPLVVPPVPGRRAAPRTDDGGAVGP